MPVHPEARVILDVMSESGLVIDESTDPAVIRARMEDFARAFFGMRDFMEPAAVAFGDVAKALREALT